MMCYENRTTAKATDSRCGLGPRYAGTGGPAYWFPLRPSFLVHSKDADGQPRATSALRQACSHITIRCLFGPIAIIYAAPMAVVFFAAVKVALCAIASARKQKFRGE